MVKFPFNLVPKKAIEYLRNKGFKLSFNYDELQKEAHHKAFTVAKITRLDLLHDVFGALTQAQKSGATFNDFKKDIIPTLQKKGWWGHQEIMNPTTGEVKEVQIGEHRLRNIFRTNMRVAQAQARYQEQMKLPNSKILLYVSALLETTRAEHEVLHNTALPREDAFWNTNYPPNGWGCVCKVRAVSEKWLQKRGLKVATTTPQSVASKDWNYNVGKDTNPAKLSKLNLDSSLSSLPSVKSIKQQEYANLTELQLQEKFYTTLGVKKGETFIDKVNDPMVIDDTLFTAASGHSKIKKQDRHLYLDEISKTIKDPDEMYLLYNETKGTLEKKMFRYYKGEGGGKRALQVIFEYQKDKTQGVTAYFIKDTKQVENRRYEKLIYQKGQE